MKGTEISELMNSWEKAFQHMDQYINLLTAVLAWRMLMLRNVLAY